MENTDGYDSKKKKLGYAKKEHRVDSTMHLPFIYLQALVKR